MAENSVFISYRREVGFPWARLVWDGLKQRSVNVFLDVESMRSAGRFDDRLFNQIAARPYFATILTAGTLERCSAPDDWMRREIEHAIATDRIIVPIFVAPFDVASFPADVPEHITEALATSHGVIVFNQYLGAALDALADDLLAPVAMPHVELTTADQEFEKRAELDLLAQAVPPAAEPAGPAPGDPDDRRSEDPSAGTPTASAAPASAAPGGAPDQIQPETTTDEPPPPPVAESAANASVAAPRRPRRNVVLGSLVVVLVAGAVATAFFQITDGDEQPSAATAAPTTSVAILPPVPATTDPEEQGRRLERLEVTGRLDANDQIVSADGDYALRMTDRGQLVMSGPQGDQPMATYDARTGAAAFFQINDGNFVVYPSADQTAAADALYSFDTAGLGAVTMRVVAGSGRGAVELLDADDIVVTTLEPDIAPGPTSPATDPSPSTTSGTSAPDTTGVTETKTPPTIPAAAISLFDVSPDESTLIFQFVNDGDVAGTVGTLVIEVGRVSQLADLGEKNYGYDIHAGRLTSGTTCTITTDQLRWAAIPPTGQPETREVTLGTELDIFGGGRRLELLVTVRLADSNAELSAPPITIDVAPSIGPSTEPIPGCP